MYVYLSLSIYIYICGAVRLIVRIGPKVPKPVLLHCIFVHGSIAHKAAAWLFSWPAQRIAFQLKFTRNLFSSKWPILTQMSHLRRESKLETRPFKNQVLANKIPTDDMACLQAAWLAGTFAPIDEILAQTDFCTLYSPKLLHLRTRWGVQRRFAQQLIGQPHIYIFPIGYSLLATQYVLRWVGFPFPLPPIWFWEPVKSLRMFVYMFTLLPYTWYVNI